MNSKLALVLLVVAVVGIAECKPNLSLKARMIAKAANAKRGGDKEPDWPYGWIEYASLVGKCASALNWLAFLEMDVPEEGILAEACPEALEFGEKMLDASEQEQKEATEFLKNIFPLLQCVNLQAEREELMVVLTLNGMDVEEDCYMKESKPLIDGCMAVFESVEKEEEKLKAELKKMDKRGADIMSMLRKLTSAKRDRYVGCRVSELTGQCQGLIHSWGLSQTIEQGYAYAKKVFVQESFQQQPFAVEDAHIWTIPVVFNKGAQIDISMSKWSQEGKIAWVGISLTNASSEENNLYQIWFSTWISPTYLQFHEEIGKYPNGMNTTETDPVTVQVFAKEMLKFTFVAQSSSVAVFFDDEEVKTIKLSAPAHVMRKISVTTLEPRVLIHSLKFTGK